MVQCGYTCYRIFYYRQIVKLQEPLVYFTLFCQVRDPIKILSCFILRLLWTHVLRFVNWYLTHLQTFKYLSYSGLRLFPTIFPFLFTKWWEYFDSWNICRTDAKRFVLMLRFLVTCIFAMLGCLLGE